MVSGLIFLSTFLKVYLFNLVTKIPYFEHLFVIKTERSCPRRSDSPLEEGEEFIGVDKEDLEGVHTQKNQQE